MFSELQFLLDDFEDDLDYIGALRLDYLHIGPVPADEDCVQVRDGVNYIAAMTKEVKRYVAMLQNRFPNPPEDTEIVLKWSDHDFGRYAEAVVVYDPDSKESAQYAIFVENNSPMTWGDKAVLDWKAGRR